MNGETDDTSSFFASVGFLYVVIKKGREFTGHDSSHHNLLCLLPSVFEKWSLRVHSEIDSVCLYDDLQPNIYMDFVFS